MKYTTVNEEVLVSLEPVTRVDQRDIEWLKAKAAKNQRKTVRLCAHRSVDDLLHEMLIVHSKGAQVRPHKHPNKSESFHIIEGKLDIVVFDNEGGVADVINMSDYSSGDRFFWRLSESYYHTVIPRSDVVVFHETTNGPFERSTSNLGAPWSPEESEHEALQKYLSELDVLLDSLKEEL